MGITFLLQSISSFHVAGALRSKPNATAISIVHIITEVIQYIINGARQREKWSGRRSLLVQENMATHPRHFTLDEASRMNVFGDRGGLKILLFID